MKKYEIYRIAHGCYIGRSAGPEDSDIQLFGRMPLDAQIRFNYVSFDIGFRCIQPIERVRNHWVVDTWLECGGEVSTKKTSLLSHKYLSSLIKSSSDSCEES